MAELSTVLCVGRHPVDLENGRSLAPGEEAEDVDVTTAHHRDLIMDGHLKVIEGRRVHKRSQERRSEPDPGDAGTKED